MDSLILTLTSAMIDNFATPSVKTVVNLKIKNDKKRVSVKNREGTPRSEHIFTINDAKYLNCPPYDADESLRIFIVALSLCNPRIYFSPLQLNLFYPNLKYGKIPSKVKVSESTEGLKISITETIRITESVHTVLSTEYELEESVLFEYIEKLLNLDPFNIQSRTNYELNVIDAINRYLEALNSGNQLDCFKSLYFALEKTVNASEERKADKFDQEAASITGIDIKQIKELRQFMNKIKHRIRNYKYFRKLKDSESNISQLLKLLKQSTDNALINRLNAT